ncbi:UNVERIFIED_ORG: DinB family protein [Bacillus sp. AZ43]
MLSRVRTDPPEYGPEREQLGAYLDYQRETVLLKADGLTAEQLARTVPPSSLTLAGLLNHLAFVEDFWFRVTFLGLPPDELWAGVDWEADPDFEFRTAVGCTPEELRERYRATCARSRQVVAEAASLDQLSVSRSRRTGNHRDLRWILLHLIEETARHAGHADLLREAIDGTTGD